MQQTELLVFGGTPALIAEIQRYEALQVTVAASIARVLGLLASNDPPGAVVIYGGRCEAADLWRVAQAAQHHRVRAVFLVPDAADARADDLRDAGCTVIAAADPAAVAAQIAALVGIAAQRSEQQVLVAVAGAKGGIGKSLVVALLAETLHRRGLGVLVVDGDISNSGLVPSFRIPSGVPSYLHIANDAAVLGDQADGLWNASNIRRYIYRHPASGIDFLLGSEETTDPRDMQRHEWQQLMDGVRGLHEYDVVLLDTGPEIKKRPYAILAARDGGWVVLPTPPGRKERAGVGNMLRAIQSASGDQDLTARCLLLFMEPEHGVTVTLDTIEPLFTRHFPNARGLGRLPRAPRQVSAADEERDRYISALDIARHSRFSRAAHMLAEQLCRTIGVVPPLPLPRSSLLDRMRGDRTLVARPAVASLGLSGEV